MATIRDVAKEANVSIATVSRILSKNEDYKISNQTKDLVFDAVKRLNYAIPENYKRKKSVACIINVTAEKHADSYYSTILESIKDELAKHNHSVDYLYTKYDFIETDVIRKFFKQKIEGFILMTDVGNKVLEALKEKTKNIVCVDTNILGLDNVRYNRFEAGCQVMQHFIENGHKKIAYIGSHVKWKHSIQFGRYDAYRMMMKRHNLETSSDWIIDCKWERQTCFKLTKKMLESDNIPTAIFFASDYMAIAGIEAINEAKKTIPGDISIIGISDIDEAQILNPPLTTIAIPKNEIGRIAAQTLLSRINGDNTISKQIYVPTKLIVRQSVTRI